MKVVYIGDAFYSKSITMMSSIYEIYPKGETGFIRTDWGKIQLALAQGKSIHIRPATPREMAYFNRRLKEIISWTPARTAK